jgi:hypothetical protein
MFTHANRSQITLTCFFLSYHPRPPRNNFTVPIFDISVSCMLQCHHWWYRYVYARQRGARRPSPRCRATWMAAHTRIADARKRAPPLMAARMGRDMFGRFQAASPLTERSWNQASRTSITQVPPCASGAAIPAAVQSTSSTLEQLARGAPAVSRRQSQARLVVMAQPSAHPLQVSCFDNIRTWYAVVACRLEAGHSQVTRRCAPGGQGLTGGIPGGRSVVRLRALLLTPKELTKVLHIGCHCPGMVR